MDINELIKNVNTMLAIFEAKRGLASDEEVLFKNSTLAYASTLLRYLNQQNEKNLEDPNDETDKKSSP